MSEKVSIEYLLDACRVKEPDEKIYTSYFVYDKFAVYDKIALDIFTKAIIDRESALCKALIDAEKVFQKIIEIHPPNKYGPGSDDYQAIEDVAVLAEKQLAKIRRVIGTQPIIEEGKA